MSTEHHNSSYAGGEPLHSDVSFEERDVQARTIYGYLFALALAAIASFVVCIFILRFLTNFVSQSDVAPPPSRAMRATTGPTMPPEPRLQGVPGHDNDPQQDLRDKMKADTEANEKAEWIDKDAGVAQIPVKDAMKMIVEKGMPTVSAPATEKKK